MAHDCFSLTCNMEGIVRVLQAARHLSHAHLAPGEHFSLLASPQNNFLFFSGWSLSGRFCCLFAGAAADRDRQVQRDDLRPGPAAPEPPLRGPAEEEGGGRQAAGRPQLLAPFRGSRVDQPFTLQSWGLKAALLDYLKRCLPADSEKHNMVALCFSMRREIGENHEMAARTQLKMIESQAWGEPPTACCSAAVGHDALLTSAFAPNSRHTGTEELAGEGVGSAEGRR